MCRVMKVSALEAGALADVLEPYGLKIARVDCGAQIPGSFWGSSEAGLKAGVLFLRPDTPVHSALHEACHFICMTADRRIALDTDAAGDDAEECAVCYLQIVLADRISGFGCKRSFADMDAWGYSFRLGSAQAWFESDAEDALSWLVRYGVLDGTRQPTGAPRS
jgi:hypothetical protein